MPKLQNKPAALDRITPRTPPVCAPVPPYHRRTKSGPISFLADTLPTKSTGGEGTPSFARILRKLAPINLAASLLFALAVNISSAQIAPMTPSPAPEPPKHKQKPPSENIEWIWQYTPDDVNKEGRENDLVQDPRFVPFLEQYLTAPQSFWGTPIDGRPRTLATTALDHLTVPGRVVAEDRRYVSVEGCVVHFCPARGLLWVDLGGQKDRANAHHLIVFAAIDWIKEGRPTTDPAAEYTLWLFPDQPFATGSAPAALTRAIARWAAEPLPGSGLVQRITHAILVDPDGTPHEVAPASLGLTPPKATDTDTDSAPALKPRN